MSITGPGCVHCNFDGNVPLVVDGNTASLLSKPCDFCGGFSQFTPAIPAEQTTPREGSPVCECGCSRDAHEMKCGRAPILGGPDPLGDSRWGSCGRCACPKYKPAEGHTDLTGRPRACCCATEHGAGLRRRAVRAEKYAGVWKALAKAAHRAWVRRPVPEAFRIIDHGDMRDNGAFEFRPSAPRTVRLFADVFLEHLDAHGAQNCLECGFYTSTGVHISVELRRHGGKTMAMLRDEAIARADTAEEKIAGVVALANELGWNGVENSKFLAIFLRDTIDGLRDSLTKVHRRAQRLEGIEQRFERFRSVHARETEVRERNANERADFLRTRYDALRVRFDEAKGKLPPPDRTASKLDEFAQRLDDGAPARVLNARLISHYLRIAAAAIRTIEWERAFDNNHELCAKANEVATGIGARHLRDLNAANATIAELRAELETLRAQLRGVG